MTRQMATVKFKPNLKACNASFMALMLLLAVNTKNTFTLLFFKDIISDLNRSTEMCLSRERGEHFDEYESVLLCA